MNRFRKTDAQRSFAAKNAGKQRIKREPYVEVVDGIEIEYAVNPHIKNFHNPDRGK